MQTRMDSTMSYDDETKAERPSKVRETDLHLVERTREFALGRLSDYDGEIGMALLDMVELGDRLFATALEAAELRAKIAVMIVLDSAAF